MWYLKRRNRAHVLKLTGQSGTKPPEPIAGQPTMVGQPVVQVFEFLAKRPGDGVLLLHYVRSWEPPSPEEQQFQIHVVVE